jgi:hypothetical protein
MHPCKNSTLPCTSQETPFTYGVPKRNPHAVLSDKTERWPRVTNNVRNASTEVWVFDRSLGFNRGTIALQIHFILQFEVSHRSDFAF